MNKFRTILSMIGIVIGVFAICAMGMVSSGFVSELNNAVASSADTLEVQSIEEKVVEGKKVSGFNLKDIRNIESAVKSVTREYELLPLYNDFTSATIGKDRVSASIYGLSPNDMQKLVTLKSGTLPKGSANVMVGDSFAQTYDLRIGSRISFLGINGEQLSCRVVGIMDSSNDGLTSVISTSSGIVGSVEWYSAVAGDNYGLYTRLAVIAEKPSDLSAIQKAIEKKMNGRENKNSDDTVVVINTYAMLEALGKILESASMFTTAISAISLLVAAVAIVNVMLMSVKERTREVGILRSIGTLKSQIMQMFLYEAGFIGFCGAVVGVLFSLAISPLAFSLMGMEISVMGSPAVLLYIPIGLAVGVCVCLLSGLYPAWKASNLNPVDAMATD